jgi:hypothetical protein
MEGAALAAKRAIDRSIAEAWHIAAFTGAASVGKLKKLSHYLKEAPKKAQTAADMLAVLREFKERGAVMNIRRVN